MKEGKEKIKSRNISEEIEVIKKREMDAMKEDKLRQGAKWNQIDPKDLIGQNLELFAAFSDGDLPTAQVKVLEVKELIDKMKKGEAKTSNEAFWEIYNGLVQKKIEDEATWVENQKL